MLLAQVANGCFYPLRQILASSQAAATPPQDYPLWLAQTKLLLTFYATMSGNKDLLATAISENGFYSLVCFSSVPNSAVVPSTE